MRKALSKSKCFTLIELIIVILIIAVLVGLSTPMFRKTFLNIQFEHVCSDFHGLLNYARQRAIFDRIEYRVKLDRQEKKFWIESKIMQDNSEEFKIIEGRYGKVYLLPPGIHIESDKDQIVFYPEGRSDAATIIVGSGADSHTFTTEGTSGYVKLK